MVLAHLVRQFFSQQSQDKAGRAGADVKIRVLWWNYEGNSSSIVTLQRSTLQLRCQSRPKDLWPCWQPRTTMPGRELWLPGGTFRLAWSQFDVMQLQCIGSLVVTTREQRLSTKSLFLGLCAKKQRCTSDLCQTGGCNRRRHKLWNKVCHSLLKKTTFIVQMFHSWTCSAAWIRCVRNGFKQAKTE